MMKKFIFIILILINIIGCAVTEQFHERKLYGNTYFSTIGKPEKNLGKFVVTFPELEEPFLRESAWVTETIEEDWTSFIISYPTPYAETYDQIYFDITVASRYGIPMEYWREYSSAEYWKEISSYYKQPLKILVEKNVTIHNQPALYTVFTVDIPPTNVNGVKNKSLKITYGQYDVFYDDFIVTFIASVPNKGQYAINDPQIMVREEFLPFQDFVESFKIFLK